MIDWNEWAQWGAIAAIGIASTLSNITKNDTKQN